MFCIRNLEAKSVVRDANVFRKAAISKPYCIRMIATQKNQEH
jgi:hypothetical protein